MSGSDSDTTIISDTGEGKFQVRARVGGAEFLIDEPASAGGLGSGPNPYNLISAALGACTAMTLKLYAEHKAWALRHVEVAVRHSRATLAARDSFVLEIALDGELDDTQRARLMQIADRCPVHLTLARGSDVHATLAPLRPQPVTGPGHVTCMEEACGADEVTTV